MGEARKKKKKLLRKEDQCTKPRGKAHFWQGGHCRKVFQSWRASPSVLKFPGGPGIWVQVDQNLQAREVGRLSPRHHVLPTSVPPTTLGHPTSFTIDHMFELDTKMRICGQETLRGTVCACSGRKHLAFYSYMCLGNIYHVFARHRAAHVALEVNEQSLYPFIGIIAF